MKRTTEEVITFIKNHLTNTEGPYDWDNFTSIKITDPKLDAIRLKCVQLDYEHPDHRRSELEKLIHNLNLNH